MHKSLSHTFILLLLITAFTACQKKQQISGKEFVERDVLVDVLVDIHIMDGVTQDRKFNRIYDVDSLDILTPILDKYQVSKQMFDTTMIVYTRDPELLDAVYNEVLIKLNVRLDEISKESESAANTPES